MNGVGKQIGADDYGGYVCLYAQLLVTAEDVKYFDIGTSNQLQQAVRLHILGSLLTSEISDPKGILDEQQIILT